MSRRDDYERLLRELEHLAQQIALINVAGIEQGICDEIGDLYRQTINVKQHARFIGGVVASAERTDP